MARIELNIVALGDFTSVNAQVKLLQTQVDLLNKSLTGVGMSSTLSKNLATAQTAFKSTMLSTGQFTMQTVAMTSETEKFGQALSQGKLKLSEYFNIITGKSSQATASLAALTAEQVKLSNSVVMSDPSKKGFLSVYTPTTINAVTDATKIATMRQDLYNLSLNASSKALVNWGKNTQWAGRQLTVGLTMPMVMFGAAAVKSFKDTNTELTRLQRLYGEGLTPPSQSQINAISGQVLNLGKQVAQQMGIAQTETVKVAANFAAMGRQGQDLLTTTYQTQRLSKLGAVDAASATNTVVALQNVYKVSTTDLANAVNFLSDIQKQTTMTLGDMTQAIPRVGPIMQQLGGTYKDTAVMLVAMREAGIPAAQAANAVKSAVASMIAPTSSASKEFAAYGINLTAIKDSTQGNPVKMIEALQAGMAKLSPLVKEQLIEKLFGKFQFARVSALLENFGKVGSQTQNALKIAGATNQELAILANQEMKQATESATAKWQRAMEGFKATLYPIGQKFLEIGSMILGIANKIGHAFSSLPGPVKMILGIFAGLAAFAGPVIMLTGLLANFAGYIMKAFLNIKMLVQGGKSFKELLTPEIIASQNAAELFSTAISNDVNAVDLLNEAIKRLTVSLEGMSGITSTGTGDVALTNAAAVARATMSPGTNSSASMMERSLPLPMYAGGEESRKLVMAHTGGPLAAPKEFSQVQASLTKDGVMIAGEEQKLSKTVMNLFQKIQKAIEAGTIDASEISVGFLNNSVTRQSEQFNNLSKTGGPGMARSTFLAQENFAGRWAVQGDLAVKRGTIQLDETMSKAIARVDTELNSLTESILLDNEFAKKMGVSFEVVDDEILALVHNEAITRLEQGISSGAIAFEGVDKEALLFIDQIRLSQKELSQVTVNLSGAAAAAGSAARSIIGGYGSSSATQRRLDAQTARQSGMSYTRLNSEDIRMTQAKIRAIIIEEGMITREQMVQQYRETMQEVSNAEIEQILADQGLIEEAATSGEDIGRAVELGIQKGLKEQGATTEQIAAMDLTALGESLTLIAKEQGMNSGKAYTIAMETAMSAEIPAVESKVSGLFANISNKISKNKGTLASGGIGMAAMMGSSYVSGIGGGNNVVANTAGSAMTTVGTVSMLGMFAPKLVELAGGMGSLLGATAAVTVGFELFKKIMDDARVSENTLKGSFAASGVAATAFGKNFTPLANYDFASVTAGISDHAKSIADNKVAIDSLTQAYLSATDQFTKDYIKGIQGKNGGDLNLAMQQKYYSDISAGFDPKQALQDVTSILLAAGKNQLTIDSVRSKLPDPLKPAESTASSLSKLFNLIQAEQKKNLPKAQVPARPTTGELARTNGGLVNTYGATMEADQKYKTEMLTTLAQLVTTSNGSTVSALRGTSADNLKALNDIKSSFLDDLKSKFGIANFYDSFSKLNGADTIRILEATKMIATKVSSEAIILAAMKNGSASFDALWKQMATKMDTIAKTTTPTPTPTPTPGTVAPAAGTYVKTAADKAAVKQLTDLKNTQDQLLKTLKDRLSAEQKITAEIKRQNDFQTSKLDLINQQRIAQASGDFLQSGLLGQQIGALQYDYNTTTKQNALQEQIDIVQAHADVFATALQDLIDAINQATSATKQISYPATVTAQGVTPAHPSSTAVVDSLNPTLPKTTTTTTSTPPPVPTGLGSGTNLFTQAGFTPGSVTPPPVTTAITPAVPVTIKTVIVQAGQTLSQIAAMNGRTVARLLAYNPVYTTNPKFNNGATLFAGDAVKIPSFHTGGVVPGAQGKEVLSMLQAGELVVPAAKSDKIDNMIKNTEIKSGGDTYQITVNAGSNASPDDIAKTVMDAIKRKSDMINSNRKVVTN